MRAQVARIVGQGDEVTTGQIPFTPRAKKVLELSLREAVTRGHNWIGTEHVLLGLVAEGEGVACRILLDFGVSGEAVREAVVRSLDGQPRGTRVQLNGPRMGRSILRSTLLLGWLLFAVALGVGIAIGWAIWG